MKTHFLSFSFLFLTTFCVCFFPGKANAQISISESKGWLESAYVKWSPFSGADSYNVYYKGASEADDAYKKIDGMLIREYADYFRADVVGLKAGNYILKVVPVSGETEDTSNALATESLEVKAYDRSGFAHSSNSPFKTGSGAYNDDGTLKSDAIVLYVTAKTANTITADIIVNNKGTTETRTGIVDILAGKQKGYDKRPFAFRVVGEVKASHVTGLNSSGYIQMKGDAYEEMNYTIEGIGNDATINGWGILVRGAGNVEVRNLAIMNFKDDGISLDTKNTNVWIHNNDFFYGAPGSDSDQAKGDGSLDLKANTRFITISYNHFWDSGKASLCGMSSESAEDYATYHHNWFDHSDSRHPRVRTMTVHVYNNYYDGVSKYGVGATMGSSVFVENNYFRNCTRPIMISLQGTDIINGTANGTFSGENGGMIKAFGNTMVNTTRTLVYHTQNNLNANGQWDAIEVTSRNESVPDTYKTLSGNSFYNNFDTNASLMYAYEVESAENAKETVMKYAGRVNGGDFKWTFDNSVDDSSYDVNTGLKTAVNNYTTTVKSIGTGDLTGGDNGGGDDGGDDNDDGGDDGGNSSNACTKIYIQAATAAENTDGAFTIAGSSTTNGKTQSYNGTSLATALKMDSKGKVTFTTTTDNAKLTVGVNANKASSSLTIGSISISDIGTTFEEKTVTLGAAGTYTIEKGANECYLYYVILKENCVVTDIQDAEKSEITLYPNPVRDNLYISSDATVQSVEVYSLTGVLMFSSKENIDHVDMSSFAAGNYIVKVRTSEGAEQKLIIKK